MEDFWLYLSMRQEEHQLAENSTVLLPPIFCGCWFLSSQKRVLLCVSLKIFFVDFQQNLLKFLNPRVEQKRWFASHTSWNISYFDKYLLSTYSEWHIKQLDVTENASMRETQLYSSGKGNISGKWVEIINEVYTKITRTKAEWDKCHGGPPSGDIILGWNLSSNSS